jgi:hypothetical protein
MRRIARREGYQREQAAIGGSMFPFLAVLICTMGALILLLVVIARQARLQAAKVAVAEAAKRDADLKVQQERIQWVIDNLEVAMEATQAERTEARLILGHLENHARQLRDELARLDVALDDLDRQDHSSGQERSLLEAELQTVEAEITAARQRLDESRRDAEQRPRSYAIVPYEGPHETQRRPIYIECRADAIVLQPEGIALTVQDFIGPLGPSNPLAAALRAAREHMLAQGEFDPKTSGEPYPLLLVRPSGIARYNLAQTAMQSWTSEFGYELIDEDWELDFGEPDPELARQMQMAVDAARRHIELLATAAPSHFGFGQPTRYRAAPVRGGAVPINGTPDGSGSGYVQQEPFEPLANRFGQPGDNEGGQEDDRSGGERVGGRLASGGAIPQNQAQRSALETGQPLRPGEWQEEELSADGSTQGSEAGTASTAKSLARSRGVNWALPEKPGTSIPISRPIRIDCYSDRLVIVSAENPARNESIPLGPYMKDSINEFVSSVQQRIESWGIAGRGMYWRPVLSTDIMAGAERRYTELSALLDGSGLEVQRHNER